uniref:uncharacterized protein LOC122592166 n=1 Tax=Erigeron canadensis TaxID=72917 RepID=UPI001CB9B9B2|nr:uncharacterized protein LOC122592166 [Erigeron canadensis]
MNQGGNVSQRPKSKDPGWKYNKWEFPNDKNYVRCNFCGFISKAGICRAKQHQIGGNGNVKKCVKVPDDVKTELIEDVERQKAKKNNDDYQDLAIDLEDGGYGDDEPDKDEAVENQNTQNKRARVEKPTSSRSNVKGPLDFLVTKGNNDTKYVPLKVP